MSQLANIFVSKDGQEHGPMTAEEFKERHRRLEFKVHDAAWREGLASWTTVGRLIYVLNQESKADAQPAPAGTPAATPAAPGAAPAPTVAAPGSGDDLQRRRDEIQKRRQAIIEKVNRVTLYAAPPQAEHRVLSPVFFTIGNKGMFADGLSRLIDKHRKQMAERMSLEMSGIIPMSALRRLGIALSMAMSGPPLLEAAYYIGIEELKERAAALGGDAIVELAHETEFDAPNFTSFCIHFRGMVARLAVKVEPAADETAQTAQAMEAIRQSMAAAAAGGGAITAETAAALEKLRSELERQQELIRTAREDLKERERFLEESESKLFEKFQEAQVREAELEQREERLGRRENPGTRT